MDLGDGLNELVTKSFADFLKKKQRIETVYPREKLPELFPRSDEWAICGAKTRSGGTCKRKGILINGRCRLHDGLSTGPKTL